MPTATDDRLSATFSALAHPVRRSMLERLSVGEATVNELAEPFSMSLPAVSRHIKVLEQAGLVTQGQRAQYRPCALDASPLREVATWAEQYRPIWEGRFEQLASYLDELDGARATSHTIDHITDQKDHA